MHIIPVIDVRHGLAVRAVAGDRANYHPLVTSFAIGADPLFVSAGYRALYPFETLYIADLDGIEGRGANLKLQRQLAGSWPGAEVWIDDGSNSTVPGSPSRADGYRATRVVGSESLVGLTYRLSKVGSGPSRDAGPLSILSLDFRGDEFLGPPELLQDVSLWPERVIVMLLARVGTETGPDAARIRDIAKRAGPRRRVYAAGGVRNKTDLRAVLDAGAAGALVATALHSGQIKTGDLEEIAGW